MREGKKTGGSHRQFSHVVGNTHQQPFGIDFLLAPEMETAEAHVVFDVADGCFDIHGALSTKLLSLLGGQIFTRLSAKFTQLETDLDLAIAFRLGALALEGAIEATLTLIMSAGTQVAIGGLGLAGEEIG